MTNSQNINRQPAGQPSGGEFAEGARGASGVSLTPEQETPEVIVNVTYVVSDGKKQAEVGSHRFDLGPFIAETSPSQRLTEFGDPTDPSAYDYWIEQAQKRGLIPHHDGSTYAYSDDLEYLVREDGLDTIPQRSEPKILPGVPITSRLTVEEVLAEADKEGFVTANILVDLADLMNAGKHGYDPDSDTYGAFDDEHGYLASRLSPLPPHGSNYQVRDIDADGLLMIDFTTNVREAAHQVHS